MSTVQKAEEYIDTYYSYLKSELNARGLQVSKVGLIGLLLHILGFTQQDIKLYYDTLFREAFVATADKYENLIMHGSIFGYIPALAKPARLTGKISFDTAVLPVAASTGVTITLQDLKVKCDKFNFTLDSTYIFKNQNCQIIDENNNITSVPISTTNPSVPIQNFLQYDVEELSYTIPFYVYNSFYSIIVSLEDQTAQICDIELYVQENMAVNSDGTPIYVPYEYKLVNYSSTGNDRHIFIQFLPDGKVLLELGSGIHGKYIPNTTLKVKLKYTYGSLGNISKQVLIPSEGILRVYDNITSGNSYTIPVSTGISIEVDYASTGTDSLDHAQLRSAILEFIRHRNNLMSETDFYDIVKFYFDDFELMFKKTHIMDNNIYCFIPVRTIYQIPARTRSISLKHSEFNPNRDCFIYNPIWTLENGKQYISPFLYKVNFRVRQYDAYILKQLQSTYFSQIINNYEDINDDGTADTESLAGNQVIALPLTMYFYYDPGLNHTRMMIQSYEDIEDYKFLVTIPQLTDDGKPFVDVCFKKNTPNIVDYLYFNTTEGTGIIFEEIDVTVKVYKETKLYFTYNLVKYKQVLDISDILSLKTFDGLVVNFIDSNFNNSNFTDTQKTISRYFNDDSYILNIPVIDLEEFESNTEYYMDRQINTLGSLAWQENRMISDDTQIRYINTDVILAEQLKASTRQKYPFDIKFPFHLKVTIYVAQSTLNDNEYVNTIQSKIDLTELLAQTLFDKYTGTNVSFYRTQIVDIIHNTSWVKHCDVKMFDDNGTEIPNANFETLPQMDIIDQLEKFPAVTYCPYYFWWDLENIEINFVYE